MSSKDTPTLPLTDADGGGFAVSDVVVGNVMTGGPLLGTSTTIFVSTVASAPAVAVIDPVTSPFSSASTVSRGVMTTGQPPMKMICVPRDLSSMIANLAEQSTDPVAEKVAATLPVSLAPSSMWVSEPKSASMMSSGSREKDGVALSFLSPALHS